MRRVTDDASAAAAEALRVGDLELGETLARSALQGSGSLAALASSVTRRILGGYVDGVSKSSREQEWTVCVYCASGPAHPELLALAAKVGEAIADRGWTLVSGGGNVSAMGALAAGARAHRGRTVGVIPKALVHKEVADVEADELVVTNTIRERKQIMEDRSHAFIALPGGIGTLEELFETWTAGYLGMHDKPVVMLDPDGHYDGLWAWLESLVDSGYVHPGALERIVVVRDVEAALALCAPT